MLIVNACALNGIYIAIRLLKICAFSQLTFLSVRTLKTKVLRGTHVQVYSRIISIEAIESNNWKVDPVISNHC